MRNFDLVFVGSGSFSSVPPTGRKAMNVGCPPYRRWSYGARRLAQQVSMACGAVMPILG